MQISIELLLHTTQSFTTFCSRKNVVHFASCYFGVPFTSFTSAYAKFEKKLTLLVSISIFSNNFGRRFGDSWYMACYNKFFNHGTCRWKSFTILNMKTIDKTFIMVIICFVKKISAEDSKWRAIAILNILPRNIWDKMVSLCSYEHKVFLMLHTLNLGGKYVSKFWK